MPLMSRKMQDFKTFFNFLYFEWLFSNEIGVNMYITKEELRHESICRHHFTNKTP